MGTVEARRDTIAHKRPRLSGFSIFLGTAVLTVAWLFLVMAALPASSPAFVRSLCTAPIIVIAIYGLRLANKRQRQEDAAAAQGGGTISDARRAYARRRG